jgi:hypothetical protein
MDFWAVRFTFLSAPLSFAFAIVHTSESGFASLSPFGTKPCVGAR